MALLANGAPFNVSWPVIEKDFLTGAVDGAEMVRAVGVFAGVAVGVFAGVAVTAVLRGFASTTDATLQNNNTQTTSTTATTIPTLFPENIPSHLERRALTRATRPYLGKLCFIRS